MHDETTRRRVATTADRELIRRFVRGELTFAQLEGMTAVEALRIARVGHGLFRRGRLDAARAIFEGLASLNPLDPYPQQILGAIAERRDEPDRARRHYDACLGLDSENAWVLARRGELRLADGDVQGGVEDLCSSLALDDCSVASARATLLLSLIQEAGARGRRAGREEAVLAAAAPDETAGPAASGALATARSPTGGTTGP